MRNFQVSPERAAEMRGDPHAKEKFLPEHAADAVKFIHVAVVIPHGSGPVLPIAAELCRDGSVNEDHLGENGFFGRITANWARVVADHNTAHPDEAFTHVFVSGDGAYAALLKEPFRIVKDCRNWDFQKPLNDQPWRENIKMKGMELDASGQYVLYDPKHQLKCFRYHIVKTGWELVAWACEGRAVSMGLASMAHGGSNPSSLSDATRTKQDDRYPLTLFVRDTLVAQAATGLRAYQELELRDFPMDWTSFDENGVCNGLHREGAHGCRNTRRRATETARATVS
jgi:hypothetical protein